MDDASSRSSGGRLELYVGIRPAIAGASDLFMTSERTKMGGFCEIPQTRVETRGHE